MGDKFLHMLNQYICPSIYEDWDERSGEPEINLKKVLKEMKLTLALFAIENVILCTPIFLLTYSISVRNQYLDEYFPQVDEEKYSTW